MQPKNLIFWGAGATAALGIRVTAWQGAFIRLLADDSKPSLKERIADALGVHVPAKWGSALSDLVTILGDLTDNYAYVDQTDDEQIQAMRRNWRKGVSDEELKHRIIELRLFYDWPALKSVVRNCPASDKDGFKINDLFNLLDLHIPLNLGFRAAAERGAGSVPIRSEQRFYDTRRLIGAKNALLMILTALFHIDYQVCVETRRDVLEKYRDFAIKIGQRSQQKGKDLAATGVRLDWPEFYQSDIGFVSLNYDPIGLWIQFIANRQLNQSVAPFYIGSPPRPLHLFHDFGHLIPARGVERSEANWPWYPLNEGAAQRLNELKCPSGHSVRLTKFLFPHGCLCWRECPDCGKLSAFQGDEWKLDAAECHSAHLTKPQFTVSSA